MASGDLSTFFVCSLLLLLCIVQASGAGLVLPICLQNMIKGEFYIPKPLQCVRHNTTSIINCSADVYYPSDNFIKISIITCELYKTTSETTTYFFGAKTNDNHTYHLPPPSVAVCSEWARTLKSNCCGRLAQISDISWATSNAPTMVYVWPTTQRNRKKCCCLTNHRNIRPLTQAINFTIKLFITLSNKKRVLHNRKQNTHLEST